VNDLVRSALQLIHDTFAKDIAQGYVTKDKQFAVDVARQALADQPDPDAVWRQECKEAAAWYRKQADQPAAAWHCCGIEITARYCPSCLTRRVPDQQSVSPTGDKGTIQPDDDISMQDAPSTR
jgi:hypothetical protein